MSDEGFERVAAVHDLDEGTPVAVQLGNGERVCLIKLGAEVFGISNNCTHADFPMSDGEMVDDFIIECGLHGAQFDVRNGGVVKSPAAAPITCYDVVVESEDVLIRPGGMAYRDQKD